MVITFFFKKKGKIFHIKIFVEIHIHPHCGEHQSILGHLFYGSTMVPTHGFDKGCYKASENL